jgi:hypothetical protein
MKLHLNLRLGWQPHCPDSIALRTPVLAKHGDKAGHAELREADNLD